MTRVHAQRSFDLPSQYAFATLSGDFNPLHLDREFARRSPTGDVVVHGVHIFLWALEEAAKAGLVKDGKYRSFEVGFLKPLYLDETVNLEIHCRHEAIVAQVAVGGLKLITLQLSRSKIPFSVPGLERKYRFPRADCAPIDRSGDDPTDCRGSVPLASPDMCCNAFPHLSQQIGADRISALLAITRIVGMECPGLYSLLSSVSGNFVEEMNNSFVTFIVARYDARFRAARLAVGGGRINAFVNAFSRQPPVLQPTTMALGAIVDRGVFLGQRALIVGGSRGLGEVTAKAISAGGGEVIITYATGEAEANAVANDIRRSGGTCEIAKYDARTTATKQLSRLPFRPTHVYYFATPRIFRRNTVVYDPMILREFTELYVDGFANLFLELSEEIIAAFYPSSVAVAEAVKGLTEYGMAKAAGEKLCSDLRSFCRGADILVRRLPRVLTDQTASVALVEAQQAHDVMLPIVTDMHKLQRRG